MTSLSAPIVAHVPNSGIVHLPERHFPGVVIQGDSLSQMFDDLVVALNAAKLRGDEDSYYSIFMVAGRMQDLLKAYEAALGSIGMERPYPVSIADRTVSDDFGA